MAAPDIARKAQAGQFVIVKMDEKGERIPLTIADFDRDAGTIDVVFQVVGMSTEKLRDCYGQGDRIMDLAGPLGHPTVIPQGKKIIVVGGGVGLAPIYPIARAFHEAGNYVIGIAGARCADLLILEDKLTKVCDEFVCTTDDGSKGRAALVTEPLKELIESHGDVDLVVAIGPGIMMKFCALTTKPFGVKTVVSLNSIMVDGTGMCGACRIEVGGETKFACADGPEFDAHKVDFDQLANRLKAFTAQEKISLDHYHGGEGCACRK
jgi:NAD(P)H-flavin reductase